MNSIAATEWIASAQAPIMRHPNGQFYDPGSYGSQPQYGNYCPPDPYHAQYAPAGTPADSRVSSPMGRGRMGMSQGRPHAGEQYNQFQQNVLANPYYHDPRMQSPSSSQHHQRTFQSATARDAIYSVPPPQDPGDSVDEDEFTEGEDMQDVLVDPKGDRRESSNPFELKWRILFISALVVYCAMFIDAILSTSSHKSGIGGLFYVHNYQGLACGWDRQVKHLPYLYFPLDPSKASASYSSGGSFTRNRLHTNRGVCVSRCPDTKDVANKAVVAIPDSATASDKQYNSAVSVLFTVNSPLYATRPLGQTICFPLEPSLQPEFIRLLNSKSVFGAHFFAGGLLKALPSGIFFVVLACVSAAILAGCLRSLAGATLMASLVGTISVGLVGVAKLVSFAITHSASSVNPLESESASSLIISSSKAQPWSSDILVRLFSVHFAAVIWAAVALLVIVSVIVLLSALNLQHLVFSVDVLGMSGGCMQRVVAIHMFPVVCSLATITVACVSFSGYFFLMGKLSQSIQGGSSEELTLNPNGGITLFPLHREHLSMAPLVTLTLVVWVMLTVWIIETIATFCKMLGTIAAKEFYNAPTDQYGNREIESNLLGRSVHKIFKHHLGATACLAFRRSISRPFGLLFFGVATRYQFAGSSFSCFDAALRVGDLDVGCCAAIRDAVDTRSNGTLSEVMSSRGQRSVQESARKSVRNINEDPMDPSARLIGLASLATYIIIAFVCTFVFVTDIFMLLPNGPLGISSNSNGSFIASPIMSALVVTMFAGAAAAHFPAIHEAFADGLLYCSLLDGKGSSEKEKKTIGQTYEEVYESEIINKKGLPDQMRDLLLRSLDRNAPI